MPLDKTAGSGRTNGDHQVLRRVTTRDRIMQHAALFMSACRLLHGVDRLRVWHRAPQDLHPPEIHSPFHRRHVCMAEAGKQRWTCTQREIPVHQFLVRYDFQQPKIVPRRQPVSIDISHSHSISPFRSTLFTVQVKREKLYDICNIQAIPKIIITDC